MLKTRRTVLVLPHLNSSWLLAQKWRWKFPANPGLARTWMLFFSRMLFVSRVFGPIFKNENRLRGCCLIEWLIHEPTDGEGWKCILIIRSQAWFCWKKDNALKKDQSSEIRQANNDCRVTFQGLTTQACLGNISQIELLSHQISVNSEYYWSSQREVTCLLS